MKKDLELMKLERRSTQLIQIHSLNIATGYEETQKVFDNVRINYSRRRIDNAVLICLKYFKFVKNGGPVDILINNAGIFRCKEFAATPIGDFDVSHFF